MKRHYSRKRMMWIFILMCMVISVFISDKVYAEPIEKTHLQNQLEKVCDKGNIYVVSQDGSGDFMTIQDGVDATQSGDTLLIYPGIYEENVEIYNKTVNLVGIDKENCILQYQSEEYNRIPLTFGAGYIANLTIYGFQQVEKEPLDTMETLCQNMISNELSEWQSNFSGYALHIDQNYTYEKEVFIENCRIISNNNQCIGIGCRGKSNIIIESCELISNGTGGCIYFHNTDHRELGGNSFFTMRDCYLKNYLCPYIISMHSMGADNPVYLTFQNVHISTVAYEQKSAYNMTNMNVGFDVDEVIALNKAGLLQNTGYYSCLNQEFVTYYDKEESNKYIISLENGVTPFSKTIALPEGISYLMTKGSDERKTGKDTRKRHIIDIFNSNQMVGDGWCGLDHIYLTPDSCGNTLIEMNYVTENSN